MDERNSAEESAGGTGVHGITMFSDLTTEEFRSNYLGKWNCRLLIDGSVY